MTLLKLNPSNLHIDKTFSILLDLRGLFSYTLLYYGCSIAFNDINQNNITDIAIGVYGEISSSGLYKNAFNLSVVRDLTEISYKLNVTPKIRNVPIGYRYTVHPFNDSFLYINSSSDSFYLIKGNNSVREISFSGEKALSASNHILFTNESIRVLYNNSLALNISSIQNVSLAASILRNNSLIASFLDNEYATRIRQLTGLEDYYDPLLVDIKRPKLISDTTLITNTNQITFDLAFSDDICLKNYTISINSKFNVSGNITGTHASALDTVITNLSDGEYQVEITIYDLAGRRSVYDYNLIIDTTPPEIRVAHSDVYNSSSVSFEMNITDDNYDFTDIYVDGEYYTKYLQSLATVTVSGLSQGKHVVELIAYDKASNYNQEEFTFIVDLEKPVINVYDPGNNTYTASQYINISVEIKDNYNLSRTLIMLNDSVILDKYLSGNDTVINQTIKLLEGRNIILIKAIDDGGLAELKRIVIYLDTEKPSIKLKEMNVNGTMIEFHVNASDNMGLASVLVYADNSKVAVYHEANFTITINFSEGIHNVTIIAIDNAGNKHVIELSLTIDVTPPTIEFLSPIRNQVYNSDQITLKAKISDNINVSEVIVYLDQNYLFSTLNSSINYSLSLADGTHNITIVAVDENGNRGVSSIIITIDTSPPEIEIISPQNNSIIEDYSFNLTISFSDNLGISRIIIQVNDSTLYNTTELLDQFEVRVNENGLYEIKVILIDVAGNKALSKVIVTVNTELNQGSPPNPDMEATTAIIIGMIGATIGILIVYTRKKFIWVRR